MPNTTPSYMPWCAAGFLAGIYTMTYTQDVPSWTTSVILPPLLLFVLFRTRLTLALLFAALGYTWMGWTAADIHSRFLPEACIGQDIQVIGYVTDLPDNRQRSTPWDGRGSAQLPMSRRERDHPAKPVPPGQYASHPRNPSSR